MRKHLRSTQHGSIAAAPTIRAATCEQVSTLLKLLASQVNAQSFALARYPVRSDYSTRRMAHDDEWQA